MKDVYQETLELASYLTDDQLIEIDKVLREAIAGNTKSLKKFRELTTKYRAMYITGPKS